RCDRGGNGAGGERDGQGAVPWQEGGQAGALGGRGGGTPPEETGGRNLPRGPGPRRNHDKGCEQGGGGVEHRSEEEPVETESHERAEDRDAQRQKYPAEGPEAVPQRSGDDEKEEAERDRDVEQAVAVHPADDHRRPGSTDRDAGTRELLGDGADRVIDGDRLRHRQIRSLWR